MHLLMHVSHFHLIRYLNNILHVYSAQCPFLDELECTIIFDLRFSLHFTSFCLLHLWWWYIRSMESLIAGSAHLAILETAVKEYYHFQVKANCVLVEFNAKLLPASGKSTNVMPIITHSHELSHHYTFIRSSTRSFNVKP